MLSGNRPKGTSMTKDEALRLAWDALEDIGDEWGFTSERTVPKRKEAITAIKEALAQPKQEPVAWISPKELLVMRGNAYAGSKDWRVNLGLEPEEGDVGLYTIPLQRTWVGLTDEDFLEACQIAERGNYLVAFQRIQAKLRSKNESKN